MAWALRSDHNRGQPSEREEKAAGGEEKREGRRCLPPSRLVAGRPGSGAPSGRRREQLAPTARLLPCAGAPNVAVALPAAREQPPPATWDSFTAARQVCRSPARTVAAAAAGIGHHLTS